MKKHVVVLIALCMLVLSGCSRVEIRFGTAAEGGIYNTFGKAFADILNEEYHSKYQLNVKNTAGSAANIRLLSEGYIRMGIAQSDVVNEMYYGETVNDGKSYQGYSAIAALYEEDVQIAVRKDSDIETLDDLDGKTVSVGQEESGTERNAAQILSAYGLSDENVHMVNYDYQDAMEHLLDGDVDVMFVTAGAPADIFSENADKIRFLSIEENKIERILSMFDGYVSATINKGTYKGQDEDVRTIAVRAVLLASNEVPEDTARIVTEKLFEHQKELSDKTGVKLLDIGDASASLSIPVHPGAVDYYKRAGIDVEDSRDADD